MTHADFDRRFIAALREEGIRERHQPREVDASQIDEGAQGSVSICATCNTYYPCDVALMIAEVDRVRAARVSSGSPVGTKSEEE